MQKGFWNGNGAWPARRRRSLLGRQNRSDNDLPQQDPQLFQQQLLQPHTTLVIPENVKTILIAGTPECWSLSTSAEEIYSPCNNNCDASLLTTVSELSPSSMTNEEDEPLPNNSDGLDWMRSQNSSSKHKRKTSPQPAQSAQYHHSQRKEPSSMVVVYRSPSQPSLPPQQALEVWCK
jgi:hypothetical protein